MRTTGIYFIVALAMLVGATSGPSWATTYKSCGAGYITSLSVDRNNKNSVLYIVLETTIRNADEGVGSATTIPSGTSAIRMQDDGYSTYFPTTAQIVHGAYLSGSAISILTQTSSCSADIKYFVTTVCTSGSDNECLATSID